MSLSIPWRPLVETIQDGEQVNAAVANRPIKNLLDQAQYLKQKTDSLSPGAGQVILPTTALGSSTLAGDFVYFDTDSSSFLQALAQAEVGDNGAYTASASAFVSGMILQKDTRILGDVLLTGCISLADYAIDPNGLIEDPINDPFVPGRYYLSRRVPGKMTRHPAAPSVLLGFFTATTCFFLPQQKDLFESHYHYNFNLVATPSGSQNYAQTGWHDFGDSIHRVDYFNRHTSSAPPSILLCVRSNGNAPATANTPVRVDIYRSAANGNLGFSVVSGTGLDANDPQSVGAMVNILPTTPWPNYGDWITIPTTNLDIAFIRQDGTYSSSLATDAAAALPSYDPTSAPDCFKVFLPNDLTGWTNANPFDLVTPASVLYRYIHETQEDLNAVFPPVPVDSAVLTNNGVNLVPGVDFKITGQGVFWFHGEPGASPWPIDYTSNTGGTMLAANARSMQILYTRSGLTNGWPVVLSLKALPPLNIVRCSDGAEADSGYLVISVDLSLMQDPAAPLDADVAFFKVAGTTLSQTNLVSRLVAGPGVQLQRLDGNETNPLFTGPVQISFLGAQFDSEIEDIELRNAKPIVQDLYSAIAFLPPAIASGITAMFKIPNRSYDVSQFALNVLGQFFGDAAVGSAGNPQTAILKIVYHVVRPGFVLSSLNESNAIAVQYWDLTFPSGYVPTTMLTPEQPADPGNPTLYQINAGTLAANPSSLVALSGGFQLGDQIVLQIDRVDNDNNGLADTYGGRLCLTGLRWILF